MSPSKKKPTGGNGGRGGNVTIVADKNVKNLNFDTFQFKGISNSLAMCKYIYFTHENLLICMKVVMVVMEEVKE